MTRRDRRLADLAALAAMMSERALAPVALAQARIVAGRSEVEALAQARTQLGADAADPVQAALMARQADRLRHRQVAALSDLARLQAEVEIAKAAARPAFGRKQVLDRLLAEGPRKR